MSAISAQKVEILSRMIAELRKIEEIIYKLRSGHINVELTNSDGAREKIHVHSSPWVKYGLLMHYTNQQHRAVADLRQQGIADDDDRVQPCEVPSVP